MRLSHFFGCAFGALLITPAFAQVDFVSLWQRSSEVVVPEQNQSLTYVAKYETFRTDYRQLELKLKSVSRQDVGEIRTGSIFELPTPDGRIQRFKIAESPIMSDELSKKSTSRTFRIQGLDDRYASGRVDIGHNGFHGIVLSPSGSYTIDPVRLGEKNQYVSYYRRDNFRPRSEFTCFTDPDMSPLRIKNLVNRSLAPGGDLKTYRLAMNATGEYTAVFGGTAVAGQAAVVTSINRINSVYEIDLAIRLTIVSNTAWTNAGTDPFSNGSGGTMLGQNQTQCDTVVGNANYDIGHVFSTGGGGVAGLTVVGVTGQKARGVTGSPSPVGDAFDIDYVAHEMGHQFGANHTFNSQAGACSGGNRSAAHAYEPGSASTIMGYAGICGVEDLQPNSDAYMHWDSMTAIWAWRGNAGSGGTSTANGNGVPTVNAGADFTIPQGTPYRLTATGSDPNSDPITYCWEQADLGTATTTPTGVSTGPLVRSLLPTTNSMRFIPKLTTVIANGIDNYEKLPNVARNINYRVTLRDNRSGGGAYATDNMVIAVVAGTPFAVTSPNTAVTYSGGSVQTITWTVGASSGTANVNIRLSTNGGTSYGTGGTTLLLANTPNDGSQTVTLPNITSSTCRIIVEGASNIFYDMSNTNFTINAVSPSNVSPNAATWVKGNSPTGTFVDLATSNEGWMTATGNFTGARLEPTQILEFSATTTVTAPTVMSLVVESAATQADTNQKIEAWNYTTSTWTNLSNVTASLTDSTYTLNVPFPTQHISGGQMKGRVTYYPNAATGTRGWLAKVDFVRWTLTP